MADTKKSSVKVEWDEATEKKIEKKIGEWSGKCDCKTTNWKNAGNCGGGGAVYGLGLIGALIYFIGTATSFWMGVLGVLKALVWPAMLVYEALTLLAL